jgi:predicted AlkP superfamily phosphohydrolase/phosphomutase
MEMGKKVLVVGLDAAPPELVFEAFYEDLPCLRSLMENGVYARMSSTHPPITIPAWMVMATSKSMGKLGLYGFRHRKPGSYSDIWIAHSLAVREKTVWDILGEYEKKVIVIGVPPSYPPKPVNGCLISCFLTPTAEKDYTYPKELKKEIEALVGKYLFDVEFRTDRKEELLKQLYEMTEKRFKVVRHLMSHKPWSFFMFVEIGLDRIQHAFWKFFDKRHHLYQPNNRYEGVIKEYYQFLDKEIANMLELVDKDTVVIVVSDHGAKRMKGAFCINEWLIKKGYLTLKKAPEKVVALEEAEVDWNKTIAWGWGGYHARIFFNLKGREPQGVINPSNYESLRKRLIEDIIAIKGPNGERWNTKVYAPEELYPNGKGNYPDLTVYFDDLSWRSAGTIGHGRLYLPENDRGPDDAVHSHHGIFILCDPKRRIGRRIPDVTILDVAPTILKIMGVPVPSDMEGYVIKEAFA